MWPVLPFGWIVGYFCTVGVLSFLVIWFVKGRPRLANIRANWLKILDFLSLTVSATVVMTLLIGKFLWSPLMSLPYLEEAIYPDINGTWRGTLRSNWINPKTGKEIDAIGATIRIRQDFFRVRIELRTDTGYSHSRTIAEWPEVDERTKAYKLWYVYENETRLPEPGPRHS